MLKLISLCSEGSAAAGTDSLVLAKTTGSTEKDKESPVTRFTFTHTVTVKIHRLNTSANNYMDIAMITLYR